jgi:hypothetical protein
MLHAQAAAEVGTVIYVVESVTWVQYLFLNYTLLVHDLPLAASCYDLLLAPYVCFMWPFWWVLYYICYVYGVCA